MNRELLQLLTFRFLPYWEHCRKLACVGLLVPASLSQRSQYVRYLWTNKIGRQSA
jgi:hypothetical protein